MPAASAPLTPPSNTASPGPLGLRPAELSSCVGCGLCLPHCPTFRVTGEEALSPRGRIAAMRSVELDAMPVDDDFVHFIDTCVQCRGCEPACPSGVPYGRLIEATRTSLARTGHGPTWWLRAGLGVLRRHRLLLVGSSLLAAAQRVRLAPLRIGRIALRRGSPVRATGEDVWLFTGCVMDAWERPTHRATAAVLARLGIGVALPGRGGGCCGALHAHAGLDSVARRAAADVMASMPGDRPILVNSAGCGAAMKDYGHLLGTADARAFAGRVMDVHEFVAARLDDLPEPPTGSRPVVVLQDPCHLRHVQRSHGAVRAVLARYFAVRETDDDGLCCGAGGAYSAVQPELAEQIRSRKVSALRRAGATDDTVVASANPGCAMHLRAAGVRVVHPMDLIAEVLA